MGLRKEDELAAALEYESAGAKLTPPTLVGGRRLSNKVNEEDLFLTLGNITLAAEAAEDLRVECLNDGDSLGLGTGGVESVMLFLRRDRS